MRYDGRIVSKSYGLEYVRMKEFKSIETNIGYEDPRMVVSISVDRGDYRDFERACHRNHEKPTELLREFMEAYAYADWGDKLEERQLEHFMAKGVDDKLIALYNKLYRIENKLDKLSKMQEETGGVNNF